MIIFLDCFKKVLQKLGEMQASQIYSVIIFLEIFLGLIFFFIGGMLLWSILFFVLAIVLIDVKITWEIGGWADKVTRKLGDE